MSGVGSALDAGQILHVVVKRLQRARGRVAQYLVQPALGFAGEQREAHFSGAVQIGVDAVEHRQHPGHMKPADRDRNAVFDQWPGDIQRTGKLVRLHAGEHHHAGTGRVDQPGDFRGADAGVGLVKSVDVDIDVFAQNGSLRAILGEPVERGEGIGGDGRTKPLNYVAGFIVMRRFYENEAEAPPGGSIDHVHEPPQCANS